MSANSTSAHNICTIKVLPQQAWLHAAATAVQINPENAPPSHLLNLVSSDIAVSPEHLAVMTGKYWGKNGVRLSVGFLDGPKADLRVRILAHMNAWGKYANVQFMETSSNPQVRIATTPGDGYWSYLGTDILGIAADKPTMNLESFTMNTPDSEFYRVIRHETGHTLGFPHEHSRKEIVDRIDREKAISFFKTKYQWDKQKVIDQVLTPLETSSLLATAHADPKSIMCYWLPGTIMKDGKDVTGGTDIDSQDAAFSASVYSIPASPIVTVFSNIGDVIYAVRADKGLLWYRHLGHTDGTFSWDGPNEVGHGWDYRQLFSGGGGVIYGVTNDSQRKLHWRRHKGYTDGTFSWDGPNEVGHGWG